MTDILDLKELASFADGDFVPCYKKTDTDARKASLQTLREFIEDNISSYVKRYQKQAVTVPSGAYTLTVTDNQKSTWVTATGWTDYRSGTLTFKFPASPVDQQEIRITIAGDTNLDVDGNGHAVWQTINLSEDVGYDVPILYKYSATLDTWFLLLGHAYIS